ncbi:MAG: ribulose-phosphate 3-epimerase [Planctomycetota bacterium]
MASSQEPNPPILAPSLLSADFANLESEIERVTHAGADWLHCDIMDGHFVPNLTFGPPVVRSLRKVTELPLDCHLMIEDPWKYAPAFVDAGANGVTIHLEVAERRPDDAKALLDSLKERGVRPGIALNPDREVEDLTPFLPHVDLVLRMSVFPGFGGQKFIPEVLPGVRRLRQDLGFEGHVQMDGGMDLDTVPAASAAGVDVFVAGTAVFGAPDIRQRLFELRQAARAN